MACTFTLQHAGTPDTLYPVAKRQISSGGGSITGSPTSGSIAMPSAAGVIRLNYTASQGSIAVVVTDKPWVVSCAKIQSELAKILAQVPAAPPIDVEAELGPTVVAGRSSSPRFDTHQTPAHPQVEVLDFGPDEGSTITVPARSQDMTRWLLVAGLGVAAIGVGYYVSKRKRPKHRRRTTKD
jgi:hypothetical protein